MKNGYKDFVSPTLDKIGINPVFENRLEDVMFAQVYLEIANKRGEGLEDTMNLVDELCEYIDYLYQHIDQIEKDKHYLLKKYLSERRLKN